MQHGDFRVIVQCHKGTGLFSRAIAWFSRSKYSHISVLFPYEVAPDGSTGTVLEAVEGEGVREIPSSWYQEARDKGKIDLFRFLDDVTEGEAEVMLETFREELGAKYDWLGVFKFVTRRRHAHDEKWFCSEIFSYVARAADRPLFNNMEDWEVKPADVPRSLALRRVV